MSEFQDRLQSALGGAHRVVQELGGAGMSRVFVAEEVALGRRVVVKVLPPDMAAGVNAERFQREIQVAASLQHPHIVPVLQAGTARDLIHYVMPFVEGESLRARLARDGRMGVTETVRLLADIASALAYAHRHGVVHRDVKPENILVTDGHAMVTDFGIAKGLARDTAGTTLTSAGMAMGTPGYMAPEQATGSPVDHRADIYGVGIVAYEMLTGRLPFEGTSLQQVLANQLTQQPIPLDRLRDDLPSPLVAAVMRCLEQEPAERWQTADELQEAFESVSTPGGRLSAAPARRVRRGRLNLVTGAAFGATVVVAVWALVQAWTGRRAPAPGAPQAVAVFPFAVRGGGDLDYLGEGMVSLLSTSLDGAGDLRAVDPRALLAVVHGEGGGPAGPEAARRLSGRLGAEHFVLGDVVRVGDSVRLTASLYDRDGSAAGTVAVQGATGDVFSLVDRLAAQLLAAGAHGTSRVTRIAAVTTASLPALKAYLEGDAAFRTGRFAPAVEAFQRAVRADSQFALAFYRLSIAAEWALQPGLARSAAAAAVRYADRLSEHDRQLLEALLAGRSADPDRGATLYRGIVAAYPEDVEAWTQLGEIQFHYGPLMGQRLAAARPTFERVVGFEPDNLAAIVHLARIAAAEGDRTALDSLASRAVSLMPAGDRTPELEVMSAAVGGDAAQRARVLSLLRGAPDRILPQALFGSSIWGADLAVAREQVAVMTEPARPEFVRAHGYVQLAHLDLTLGRWASAQRMLDSAAALDPAQALEYRSLMVLAPFVPSDRPALEAQRTALERFAADRVPPMEESNGYFAVNNGLHPAIRHYLLGLTEARLGQAARAQERAAELARAPVPEDLAHLVTRPLARSVRAAVHEAQDQRPQALAALGALDVHYEPAIFSAFYSRAQERWRRATLLEALGRLDEAARWYRSFRDFSVFDRIYEAPADYRLGLIAERQGDTAEARARYASVVRLWAECDPEFRAIRDDARARLERLQGQ